MKSTPPPVRNARVLLVDDNRDILVMTERFLDREGYELRSAADGLKALEEVRRWRPDLVLLDIMLPGMDGLEVLKRIRDDPETRGTMVILVSGRGAVEHRAEGLDSGADDYITKPFHMREFLARIRSALRIKRLQDQLRERHRQLLESQRKLVEQEKMATIGLLAAGIAHEFNNIMSGISGYAQIARRNPKYREKLVEVALVQSERAQELTSSLSTLAKPPEESRTPTAVPEIIANALCLVGKDLEERNIHVHEDHGEALPEVSVSRGQIQEVFLNILINAIHAIGRHGTITIETRRRGEGEVAIRLRDTGSGIPEEIIERIFDPFFTTKGALGGGQAPGTGLGLSVARKILRAHGGDIRVESRLGSGSTFEVLIPVGRPQVETVSRKGTEPIAVDRRRRLRILVVDDDPHAQEILREAIPEAELTFVQDSERARESFLATPVDFVLLDVAIRGQQNGFELFEDFQKTQPGSRVIFTSGRLPDPRYEEYIARAHAHLQKPFDLSELRQLLSLEPLELLEGPG